MEDEEVRMACEEVSLSFSNLSFPFLSYLGSRRPSPPLETCLLTLEPSLKEKHWQWNHSEGNRYIGKGGETPKKGPRAVDGAEGREDRWKDPTFNWNWEIGRSALGDEVYSYMMCKTSSSFRCWRIHKSRILVGIDGYSTQILISVADIETRKPTMILSWSWHIRLLNTRRDDWCLWTNDDHAVSKVRTQVQTSSLALTDCWDCNSLNGWTTRRDHARNGTVTHNWSICWLLIDIHKAGPTLLLVFSELGHDVLYTLLLAWLLMLCLNALRRSAVRTVK